jgi:hypothetical protein
MLRIGNFLASFVFLFLLAGCASGGQQAKTTEVQVYRTHTDTAGMGTMRELCREVRQQGKYGQGQTEARKVTREETYSRDSLAGGSEYRREYSETSRYSPSAVDRDKMIQLCLENE